MTVIQIKINCLESYDSTNRKSNCNFQILNTVFENNIEYYKIPINNFFYKAIDKKQFEVLDFNDSKNTFKNIPIWLGDLKTANIYHTIFKEINKYSNIYAFTTIKELKLINLLSNNNILLLYTLILKDIEQIWISIINNNNDLDNKYENLFKFINYKFTIGTALGFNITFKEQLNILKATKNYQEYYKFGEIENVRFEINNNLHSHLKEDFNRISLFKTDYILVKILQYYFPDYDGYCSYRTKSLIHNEFHEEICIFNPENCIRRQKNNICDANNPRNFIEISKFLNNNKSNFILNQSGGLEIETIINSDNIITNINEKEIFEQSIINCLNIGIDDLKIINIDYLNFFIISYNEINNQYLSLFNDSNIYKLLNNFRIINNYISKESLNELNKLKNLLIIKIEKKIFNLFIK